MAHLILPRCSQQNRWSMVFSSWHSSSAGFLPLPRFPDPTKARCLLFGAKNRGIMSRSHAGSHHAASPP